MLKLKKYLKHQGTWKEVNNCELKVIFKDGLFLNQVKLTEIRKRIKE